MKPICPKCHTGEFLSMNRANLNFNCSKCRMNYSVNYVAGFTDGFLGSFSIEKNCPKCGKPLYRVHAKDFNGMACLDGFCCDHRETIPPCPRCGYCGFVEDADMNLAGVCPECKGEARLTEP